jgi:hypothetical protein
LSSRPIWLGGSPAPVDPGGGFRHDPQMEISGNDLHRVRQWFDAIQDTNPAYLEIGDFVLAKRIYESFSQYVPRSITERISSPAPVDPGGG